MISQCPVENAGCLYGGPGCPGVAEFAVAEFAVVLGVSTESAAKYIGQALALRHRLPLCWSAVKARGATPWKARQIATACQELSLEAAAIVDRTVSSIIDTVGPIQLRNIIKAAIWDADPEAAHAAAEQKARERGVWTGRSDDHGTTTVFVKASTGDVIRFDATLNQIADTLTVLGDPASRQHLRAKAIGILADPALAHQLLDVARHLATTQPPTAPPPPTTPPDAPANSTSTTSGLATTPPRPTTTTPTPSPTTPTNPTPTNPTPAPTPTGQSMPPVTTSPAAPCRLTNPRSAPTAAADSPSDDVDFTEPTPADVTKNSEPAHDLFLTDEPTADTDADRDPPHPSAPNHPLDRPEHKHGRANTDATADLVAGMDTAARQELTAKLSAMKAAADHAGQTAGSRPGHTKLYVHLTDETLLAGGGVMRVEAFGPIYASLAELLGHDRIVIQPVVDLHDQINVNAYEISRALRERIKLTYPVEQFPYGSGETTHHTDLDHVIPYTPIGSPGQTSTGNLRPLRRRSHRIKTHAGWKTRTLTNNTTEWTTPHGYTFHVTPTGTHPLPKDHP